MTVPPNPGRPDTDPADDRPGVTVRFGPLLTRAFLARDVMKVAPDLLGRVLLDTDYSIAVRLTEVEAYAGPLDPASHAFRRTARSEIMYGPAGVLYVYFIYGMHWCANIVTGRKGTASAVLMRAGEVIYGEDVAENRRPSARRPRDLARGPAALASAMGLTGRDTGEPVVGKHLRWELRAGTRPPVDIVSGPRVGVSTAQERPWRFYEAGNETVSVYRSGGRTRRRRPTAG